MTERRGSGEKLGGESADNWDPHGGESGSDVWVPIGGGKEEEKRLSCGGRMAERGAGGKG